MENDSWKILWGVTIQTDHVTEARRPDMVIIDKTQNEWKIIDLKYPFDSRNKEREKDEMKSYSDLMGYASESNPCSSRCIRSNTKEIKAAIE